MKNLIALIIICFSFPTKSNEVFNKMGIVANECNQFENLKDFFVDSEKDTISLKSYFISAIQGFLSGINYSYEDRVKSWKNLNHHSTDFMFLYIRDYCNRNPDELIEEGLWEYFFKLPDIKK